MIKRLLIANRGEIAVRIVRCCREMGIETVAVYSTADRESLHVKMADNAVCVGPPPAAESYLVKKNLITAALRTGCEAVHPGVGFLSENADFARMVGEQGLVFIGPAPETIELLGDKVRSRNTALSFGLPVTPGTKDAVKDFREARKTAGELGFPLIIKAAAGGGGKGMRIVRAAADLEESLAVASREAESNFADGKVFMEKYLENPRHVELQIMADGNGKVAVLGERDCSVQKNHQKLIEESPSPGVGDDMRARMTAGAVNMFRELKYRGAGTIEFLVQGSDFYFMEVNARVQVEHPVSECVSGVDIIREQILASTEGRIETVPQNVRLSGWAVECRVNALAPGNVSRIEVPGGPGVRFDSFLSAGCSVPPHYDALVAKLIVHAPVRERALARMEAALEELTIEGLKTNKEEQLMIIRNPVFRSGNFGTAFYESIQGEINRAG